MGRLLELGERMELVSMDPHFHDISISLYRETGEGDAAGFLAHSYSGKEGAAERLAFVMRAMAAMGGMGPAPGQPSRLAFACGGEHRAAVKRLFLEACKKTTGAEVAALPMSIYDKKNDLTIDAATTGGGGYRLAAGGGAGATTGGGAGGGGYRLAAGGGEGNDKVARRVDGVTRGLIKLAEMEPGAAPGEARFACGSAHDELVGLLIGRALNVRAAMREAEAAAARGVLAAPSAQQQT